MRSDQLIQEQQKSPVMTVRQAAAFLSCARNHVFNLIHRGLLPYQRMGKRFVVPKEAVELYLLRGWTRNGK
jgi:excisionase family DNA binding protein